MITDAPDLVLIIPARNEELSLPGVLRSVPPGISRVVVVDNGSTDGTAAVARAYGARVVYEPVPGYGRACLAGLAALRGDPPELVAFVDADGSDELASLPALIAPVACGEQDFVLGERIPSVRRALSFQQRFGHLLATGLIKAVWRHRFADLGPMRVIRWSALETLEMADLDFGWTVEMQIRAVQRGLKILEIPVPYYPRRAGKSKISRTIRGTFRAGATILWVIGRELVQEQRRSAKVSTPEVTASTAP